MLQAFQGASPTIDSAAFVHPAAVLIGDVRVGAESSVWPNVTLRGDDGPVIIGSQTSIQDGSTIHCMEGFSRTTVGSRVTVGHNVVLHGCTIEDDALIGMGSIILDNARVERGALVAAGTVVPAGKGVEAGTMVVGNPFRVIRACSARDKGLIEFSWRAYVKRTAQYLEEARAGRGDVS